MSLNKEWLQNIKTVLQKIKEIQLTLLQLKEAQHPEYYGLRHSLKILQDFLSIHSLKGKALDTMDNDIEQWLATLRAMASFPLDEQQKLLDNWETRLHYRQLLLQLDLEDMGLKPTDYLAQQPFFSSVVTHSSNVHHEPRDVPPLTLLGLLASRSAEDKDLHFP